MCYLARAQNKWLTFKNSTELMNTEMKDYPAGMKLDFY